MLHYMLARVIDAVKRDSTPKRWEAAMLIAWCTDPIDHVNGLAAMGALLKIQPEGATVPDHVMRDLTPILKHMMKNRPSDD